MTNKITDLICQTLLITEIQPDEDLFEAGYLDSLAIINLMVSLEQTFDITLSPETLDLDHFRTALSIQSLIEPLVQTPAS